MRTLALYLGKMTVGRFIFWCYASWYGFVLCRYFETGVGLWLNTIGISLIVAVGFSLNFGDRVEGKGKFDFGRLFRLFIICFSASSFAALVKHQNFVLIFSPKLGENLVAIGIWLGLGLAVLCARRLTRSEIGHRT